ncbi:hypothetical protein ACFV8G_34435, partial [Streptomyces sp. NPDC059873]
MESGPAIFAGTAFTLFSAALLLWTGARVLHRAPVAAAQLVLRPHRSVSALAESLSQDQGPLDALR